MTPPPRGLILAAPRSGSGKSTLTMGILRALKQRGVAVQPFKCGPDYIDPGFHAAACGRPSLNLDLWAMRRVLIAHLIETATGGCELCFVEGVMGLFDGARTAGQCGRGSTADLAELTGWPVVLVIDVAAQAETAAAVTLGLHTYREGVRVAGVILNCVGSPGHAAMVAEPIERLGIPVLGALSRNKDATLGERHLGLVQAAEAADLDARIETIGRAVAQAVDLDALLRLAQPSCLPQGVTPARLPPPGQRIALAQDAAFSFTYPHIIEGWCLCGAEITTFSPLADEGPAADADAVWLPGGYPELYAARLAAAGAFRRRMQDCAARGAAIHGECGGYMVLGTGLEDAEGQRHAMLGLLGLETSYRRRQLHLGYRRACPIGAGETELLGHEFHYSSIVSNPDPPFAIVTEAAGSPSIDQGARRQNVTGTFFHVIDRGE